MLNITQAISTWLAQGNPAVELMLQFCRFQADTRSHLDIYCPHKLLDALLLHLYSIDWQASKSPSHSIAIFSDTAGKISFELSLFPETFYPQNCCDKDILGLQLLSKTGVSFSYPLSIVEMGSNRGIFCSTEVIKQYQIQCGIDGWIDADLSPYYYPDQLRKLDLALEQGNGKSVEWMAKTSQGELMKITGNIFSDTLNGIPVRVAEHLACVLA